MRTEFRNPDLTLYAIKLDSARLLVLAEKNEQFFDSVCSCLGSVGIQIRTIRGTELLLITTVLSDLQNECSKPMTAFLLALLEAILFFLYLLKTITAHFMSAHALRF
jgi:hypothetical protein